MDSLESDLIPSTMKVSAHVDVAIVDPGVVPGVDTGFPRSEAPPLTTAYDGSCSASPKQSEQPNAWSKPLTFTQPSSAVTVLMQTSKDLIADLSRETQWPSLLAANCAPSRRRQPVAKEASQTPTHHNHSLNGTTKVPQGVCDTDPEYPWASKMEKSKRNLHKVTSPEFLEDGTPKVRIPSHVLLEGLENQKEFVIGQFYRCSAPASALIQSVVSRIWGTRCRIYTRHIGNNSFLFHIPDEPTRKWVVQRGIWHVDDCLMFVSTWDPKGTITVPEISTIPVWLTLKDIPNQLYSKKGISWIASGIGAPMLTSKPWLDPILMGEAKIMVEVKLDRPFPQRVALEDESGSISMVSVIYSLLPSVCPKCGQLGHKAPRCLGLPPIPISKASQFSTPKVNSDAQDQLLVSTINTDSVPGEFGVAYQSLKATETVSLGTKESLDITSIDSQGCILLDHEESDLTTEENPEIGEPRSEVTTVSSVSVVTVNTPINTPTKDVSVASAPKETAHVTPVIDEKEIPTTNVMAASSSDETFEQIDVSKHVDSSPHSPPPTSEASLASLVKVDNVVDNTFSSPSSVPFVHKNLFAVLDNDEAKEPAAVPDLDFVFTSSPLPTSDSAPHDFAPGQPRDLFEDSTLRSRGGRPLKPSQRLKEMEWFTVGKGRRGRGKGPHH